MKTTQKIISFLLIVSMCIALVLPVSADNAISVYIDNKKVSFDVQPQLIGGRTMVPLRAIFEGLGATVQWDEKTRTVTAYNEATLVKATIDVNVMSVNGEERMLDVPPMLIDGRTLVPARFVAEAFGCNVQWEASTRSVYITTSEINYDSLEQGNSNSSNDQASTPIPIVGDIIPYKGTSNVIDYGAYTGAHITMFGEEDGYYVRHYRGANKDWFLSYCEVLARYGWEIIEVEGSVENDGWVMMHFENGESYQAVIFDWNNDQTVIIYNEPQYFDCYYGSSVVNYMSVTGAPLKRTVTDEVYHYVYQYTTNDDVLAYCAAMESMGWEQDKIDDASEPGVVFIYYVREGNVCMIAVDFIYNEVAILFSE